jgi:hypothetical protein
VAASSRFADIPERPDVTALAAIAVFAHIYQCFVLLAPNLTEPDGGFAEISLSGFPIQPLAMSGILLRFGHDPSFFAACA